jgi:DNA-binding CsgD family transcriptional regulator
MQHVPKKYLCFFLVFISVYINCQEFTPIASQFTKKDYNASNQNWSVSQCKDGIMYFGNNHGLLHFDGTLWETHIIPDNKNARSLLIKGERIFTGSFEEFGYFEKNSNGQLIYTSLSDNLLDYDMQNDEIWNILDFEGTIIFQSFTSYFTFDKNGVKGFRCPYTFLFFNIYNRKIYTHTNQLGFSTIDLKTNVVTPVHNSILKSPVISVLPYNSVLALLITKSDGLFLFDGKNITPFQTVADADLKKDEINRAVITPDSLIVLGTILNGVSAFDKKGRKLWNLNTSNVLQNNTVLGMYCDRENNLWLAMDKGISHVQINSSIRYINSFKPSIGAIYSISYSKPGLYIGTNQGLYKARLAAENRSIEDLHLEPQIKGQVWDVNKFDNQQICGNNEETYEITENGTRFLSPVKGGICMKKGYIYGKEVLVQGTYTQICIYEKIKGVWTFSHALEDFINPIRYIEIDYTGTIWAGHLHQNLYAIRLSSDLKKIDSIKTFESLNQKNQFPINVFTINNRVVFTDNTGFYTFDDIQKKIIPFDELNQRLGYFSHAYRICHFKDDQFWFIRNNEAALFEIKATGAKLIDIVQYSRFLNQSVDDYQNIIPISDKECLFTLDNGLALYHSGQSTAKQFETELLMKRIQTSDAESKEIVLLPLQPEIEPFTSFKQNNIAFTVYYPQYNNFQNLSFRFKLEGLDKVWTDPSATSHKEYKYLPHGKYTFKAEVQTKSGIVLSGISYSFEVLPPFYLSLTAKIIYLMIIILLIIIIYLYIQRSFHVKKEKIRLEQEEIRHKEIEKRENKIIALQNEKLETELTIKSKELAESTMTIIKKNEILVTIKEEVMAQKIALGSHYPAKYYDKLIKLLDENLTAESDWAIFQTNFDRIHENFFRNLHIQFPDLTSNDLRFCAYLRLNLSSKDIAHLMNISLKGVEVARYRIRKKIGIPSTKSLTEFMMEFK